MNIDHVKANGATIPKLGFGTFQLTGNTCRDMVTRAIEAGYRHIDTAQMYGNEAEIGAGIRDAGVPRHELFLTTKAWPDRFREGDLQRSVRESVERAGLEQFDLVLLHWPNPEVPLGETMAALGSARERRLTRHIGVSNFPAALMEEAIALSTVPLVTNQVEYHPYLSQARLLETVRQHGLSLTAYAPLGQSKVLGDRTIRTIAERHDRHPAQIILRWHYQQPDVIAIPRSAKPTHMQINLDILDFELSRDEMDALSALARPDGRIISPAGLAPAWDEY